MDAVTRLRPDRAVMPNARTPQASCPGHTPQHPWRLYRTSSCVVCLALVLVAQRHSCTCAGCSGGWSTRYPLGVAAGPDVEVDRLLPREVVAMSNMRRGVCLPLELRYRKIPEFFPVASAPMSRR